MLFVLGIAEMEWIQDHPVPPRVHKLPDIPTREEVHG